MRKLVLVSLALIGFGASAVNMTFDKAVDIELQRCKKVMPIEEIYQFSLMNEFGFASEADLKKTLGDAETAKFKKSVEVVRPFLESLDTRGEIMDLTGKDELTTSCAKFAKGFIVSAYQKLLLQMFLNAVDAPKLDAPKADAPKAEKPLTH